MGNRSQRTHGASFFSAVTGAPWDDVSPLAGVLEVTLGPESDVITAEQSRALWQKLSYLGSNDLAYLLRGFEGVDYPEIVRDVCKALKLRELRRGEEERAVEHNEQLVLARIFADGWEHLDADQRRELLRELNLDEANSALSGAGVAAAALGGRGGPFAVYRLSRIVANSVARVLPGRRLSTARRKTLQAVVLVASLRQAQRTALAETALPERVLPEHGLLDAAGPAREAGELEAPGEGPSQRRRAKRPATKKAAAEAAAPPRARKTKAGKASREARERAAKKARSRANPEPKKPATKERAAKKRAAKKPPAKKATAKKKKAAPARRR